MKNFPTVLNLHLLFIHDDKFPWNPNAKWAACKFLCYSTIIEPIRIHFMGAFYDKIYDNRGTMSFVIKYLSN